MKDKSKVLKTYRYMFDKLQFIGLIGGRVLTWGRRVHASTFVSQGSRP